MDNQKLLEEKDKVKKKRSVGERRRRKKNTASTMTAIGKLTKATEKMTKLFKGKKDRSSDESEKSVRRKGRSVTSETQDEKSAPKKGKRKKGKKARTPKSGATSTTVTMHLVMDPNNPCLIKEEPTVLPEQPTVLPAIIPEPEEAVTPAKTPTKATSPVKTPPIEQIEPPKELFHTVYGTKLAPEVIDTGGKANKDNRETDETLEKQVDRHARVVEGLAKHKINKPGFVIVKGHKMKGVEDPRTLFRSVISPLGAKPSTLCTETIDAGGTGPPGVKETTETLEEQMDRHAQVVAKFAKAETKPAAPKISDATAMELLPRVLFHSTLEKSPTALTGEVIEAPGQGKEPVEPMEQQLDRHAKAILDVKKTKENSKPPPEVKQPLFILPTTKTPAPSDTGRAARTPTSKPLPPVMQANVTAHFSAASEAKSPAPHPQPTLQPVAQTNITAMLNVTEAKQNKPQTPAAKTPSKEATTPKVAKAKSPVDNDKSKPPAAKSPPKAKTPNKP